MSADVLPAGTCRYCSCREETPCDGGCAWADDGRTLCTTCLGAESIAEKLLTVLGDVATAAQPRVRLVASAWMDLTHEQKTLLVMTCRGVVETVSEALQEDLTIEAAMATVELNTIAGFLLERCPDQIEDGEPISHIVSRLLEPHLGSRIVLP